MCKYNAIQKESRRIIIWGGLSNLCLAVLKIFFGFLGQSHALLADGFHSAADLFVDTLVYFAAKYGTQRPDDDHPYGHGRIETAGTLALAFSLVVVGIGIIWDSIQNFNSFQHVPKLYVLGIVIISLIAKEFFYQWTIWVARRLKSELLKANAWHHRSDAASSLVVLIGVSGALLGFHNLDAIAAIIVGMLIIKMAWSLAWSSLRELVDTGIQGVELDHIRQTIREVKGVCAIHQLRTRSMAGSVFVDVHIMVNPHLTVSEGHFISQQVHLALVKGHETIGDVTVHVDPEDDGTLMLNRELLPRHILLPQLMTCWRMLPGVDEIKDVRLHYLSGKIICEVFLPLVYSAKNSELIQQYQQATRKFEYISAVNLFFTS